MSSLALTLPVEADARALAGLKDSVTNLAVLTPELVIGAYQRLFRIEKSFRMSKHYPRAQPIYHCERDSTDADSLTTKTTYTPATGAEPTTIIVSDPLIYLTITKLDPLRDLTLSKKGAARRSRPRDVHRVRTHRPDRLSSGARPPPPLRPRRDLHAHPPTVLPASTARRKTLVVCSRCHHDIHHRRHRPSTSPVGSDLEAVPDRASQGHRGDRLPPCGYRFPQTDLRAHPRRARYSSGAPGRSHRQPNWCVNCAGGPQSDDGDQQVTEPVWPGAGSPAEPDHSARAACDRCTRCGTGLAPRGSAPRRRRRSPARTAAPVA